LGLFIYLGNQGEKIKELLGALRKQGDQKFRLGNLLERDFLVWVIGSNLACRTRCRFEQLYTRTEPQVVASYQLVMIVAVEIVSTPGVVVHVVESVIKLCKAAESLLRTTVNHGSRDDIHVASEHVLCPVKGRACELGHPAILVMIEDGNLTEGTAII
jgi:hypothetical protein